MASIILSFYFFFFFLVFRANVFFFFFFFFFGGGEVFCTQVPEMQISCNVIAFASTYVCNICVFFFF